MKKRVNIIIPFITFFFISVMALAFGFLFAIIYPAMGLDIETIFEHIGTTFIIAFMVTLLVAIIIYRLLKPIDRIVNKQGQERELSREEKEKIIKTEKNIKFILIIVTIIGFIVAPLAATILSSLRTGLLRWSTIRFLIVSWSLGPTAAFFLILFFSYIMYKIKVACQIFEFSLQKQRKGIKTELIATLVSFTFTAIVILVCQSITRDELIAGISHVAFYTNQNVIEPTDGYFSNLLRLSQKSTDPAVKRVAEAIIKNWPKISTDNNLYIILIGAITFSFICLCIVLYAFNISSQLKTTRNKLKTVVKLEGDLTNLLVKTSTNEIGDIQVLFNMLIININRTLKNLFKVANNIIGITKSEKETIEALITANDEIKHTAKTVSQELSNQLQISKKTTQVVEDVIKLIKENIDKITNQAAMVEQSSAAINQMNSSIKAVSQSTKKATHLGETLNQSSKQGIDVTVNMNESIANISKFGMNINEIVNTISTITSQTDLLAMNAAIEAAHAGQYGKGFAVVADEIRTLAETTANQTKEIEAILDSMSASIEKSVSCSGNLSTRMNNIKEGVTNTIKIINEINNAAQEQLANSNQNMTIINELLNTTQKIMENLEKQSNMNEQLSATSLAMKDSVQQIDDAEKKQEQYFNSLRASFENFIQFFNQTKASLNLLEGMLQSVKLIDDNYLTSIKDSQADSQNT